jgi:hypothetical protein
MYYHHFRLLSLYTYLIVIDFGQSEILHNGDELLCIRTASRPVEISHCEAAIKMIPGPPQVNFSPTSNITKPINLDLDKDGVLSFHLPAVFVAGTCIVSVNSIPPLKPPLVPPPPQQAATFMAFVYWPKVKETASVVLERCVHGGNKVFGRISTKSLWKGWEYHYAVWVEDSRYVHQKGGRWNVYQSKEVPWRSSE